MFAGAPQGKHLSSEGPTIEILPVFEWLLHCRLIFSRLFLYAFYGHTKSARYRAVRPRHNASRLS